MEATEMGPYDWRDIPLGTHGRPYPHKRAEQLLDQVEALAFSERWGDGRLLAARILNVIGGGR